LSHERQFRTLPETVETVQRVPLYEFAVMRTSAIPMGWRLTIGRISGLASHRLIAEAKGEQEATCWSISYKKPVEPAAHPEQV